MWLFCMNILRQSKLCPFITVFHMFIYSSRESGCHHFHASIHVIRSGFGSCVTCVNLIFLKHNPTWQMCFHSKWQWTFHFVIHVNNKLKETGWFEPPFGGSYAEGGGNSLLARWCFVCIIPLWSHAVAPLVHLWSTKWTTTDNHTLNTLDTLYILPFCET